MNMQACLHAKSLQSCPTLYDPMDCYPASLFCPWDSPGKNTGVGYHAFLQGNLSDPRIKPHLLDVNLHWQVGSLPLAPPGCVCRYICIYTCTYIYFYIHKKKSGRIHQKMLRIQKCVEIKRGK